MLESILIYNIWLALLVWVGAYISDYYLTLYTARLYRQGMNEHVIIEGSLELTPIYQKDIDRLVRVSPRFLFMLFFSSGILLVIWLATVRFLVMVWLFSAVFGGLLLLEVAVHMRHLRNIVSFRLAKAGGGLNGKIEQRRWYVLGVSAAELFGFVIFYTFMALFARSWFFVGGAIMCLRTAWQHYSLARKAARSPAPAAAQL